MGIRIEDYLWLDPTTLQWQTLGDFSKDLVIPLAAFLMTTLILGIESFGHETAAAVVADGRHVLANVVATQLDLHAQYGGVFPELAARAHIAQIYPVIQTALEEAQVTWTDRNSHRSNTRTRFGGIALGGL